MPIVKTFWKGEDIEDFEELCTQDCFTVFPLFECMEETSESIEVPKETVVPFTEVKDPSPLSFWKKSLSILNFRSGRT